MDALGQRQSQELCLKTTFQEIFDFQTQDVIELHFRFIEHTDTDQTTKEGIA